MLQDARTAAGPGAAEAHHPIHPEGLPVHSVLRGGKGRETLVGVPLEILCELY